MIERNLFSGTQDLGRTGALPWAGARAYLLACCCLGSALGVRLALDPLWGNRVPYITFFLAQLVVIRFSIGGPLIFNIVSGFILADWYFIPPRHSLLITNRVDQVNTAIYFLVSFVVLLFARRTRRALAMENAARGELERHAAELARVAAIVECSDDAIIGKSLDGTILSWNAGAQSLYGYTSDEAIGKSISILLPRERKDELTPLLVRVSNGERISHFESTRRAKDGRLLHVSLSISPVRDSSGTIVGASTIARDITERKKAESERERLVRQLQEALANVKTLSGLLPICSHCKKIRDDNGYWNQIELFIRDRSNANFSHGVCPECAKKHYPSLFRGVEIKEISGASS